MNLKVGRLDRILRDSTGLASADLAATGTLSPWSWIGLVLLATAAPDCCPAYSLLGMNRGPMQKP